MSSRNPAPANLKERIAAFEQQRNAQKQNPSSSSSSSSSAPNPNSLRDKIAKFEKKGGVPVPRGSFGLGAPPPTENAPAKRRGELYGNRIPTPRLKSHHTGNGMMGSGLPPTSRPTSPLGFPVQNKRMSMSGLDFEAYHGVDFTADAGLDTGSESGGLNTPAEYGEFSPMPTPTLSPTATGDIDTYLQMRQEAKANKQKSNFAAALDAAKKAEAEGRGMYHSREGSMSPETKKRYSMLGDVDDGDSPVILVSETDEGEVAQEPGHIESDLAAESSVEPQLQSREESPKEDHIDSDSPLDLSNNVIVDDLPKEDPEAEEDQTTPRASAIHGTSSQAPSSQVPSASFESSSEPSPASDTDNDKSLLITMITSGPVPETPISTTGSVPVPQTPLPQTPISATPSRLRDSFISTRPSSMIDASPGHITFAQRISPITGKAIYIPPKSSSLAKESSDEPPTEDEAKVDANTNANDTDKQDDGQLAQVDEFGVVTLIGPVPPKQQKQPVSRSFSAVVHSKARDPSSSSTYASSNVNNGGPPAGTLMMKSNTLPRTPARNRAQLKLDEPTSPGFADLAMLMETSALLEQRLMAGDIPSEFGREAARGVGVSAGAGARGVVNGGNKEKKDNQKDRGNIDKDKEDERRRKTEMAHDRERKKSTVSTKSTETIRKKLSLKSLGKKFSTKGGQGQKGDEQAKENANMNGIVSRKASVATVTPIPDVPSLEITPPYLKSKKDQSLPQLPSTTTDSETLSFSFSNESRTHAGELNLDLEIEADKSSDLSSIPPTPPPKSPSYLATIRRLAASGKSRAARVSRSFSDASAAPPSSWPASQPEVVTPPETSSGSGNEFQFLSNGGNRRSGFIGPSGGGSSLWQNQNHNHSVNQSPKKGGSSIKSGSGGSIKGGIGRMLSRRMSRSGNSLVDDGDDSSSGFSGIPKLPAVVPPSPSLHELILSVDSTSTSAATVPSIQEPSELPYASNSSYSYPYPSTPPPKNLSLDLSSSTSPDSSSMLNNSRASWISGYSSTHSSSATTSPLFDKEFFDSFPSVPQTMPANGSGGYGSH